MFEGSLVESRHLLRTNNRWTGLISVLFQTTAVLALVALPLLHPEALPYTFLKPESLTAPLPPEPVKPVEAQRVQAANSTAMAMPLAAPRMPSFTNSQTDPEPEPSLQPVTMRVSDLPSNLAAAIGNGPRVVAQPAATQGPTKPVRVSAGVAQGMLLTPFHPVYPPIAIAARVEGTVVVQAVISKSGSIESLHVASGPPLLTLAALDAIRAARYAPYRLSGEPVEVETTISVIFKLGS